jgi:hypothetical protein
MTKVDGLGQIMILDHPMVLYLLVSVLSLGTRWRKFRIGCNAFIGLGMLRMELGGTQPRYAAVNHESSVEGKARKMSLSPPRRSAMLRQVYLVHS